jgi:hypothetical protein
MGLSDCDGNGLVDYIPFSKICADFIEAACSFHILVEKDQLVTKILEIEGDKGIPEHPAIT